MSITLGRLAVQFGCELRGDPDTTVDRVGTLDFADGSSVAFLANPIYRKLLPATKAAAVILDGSVVDDCPVAALIASNPYAVYARVAELLYPAAPLQPGVHETASVAPGCEIPESSEVAQGAVIEAGVTVAERVYIGPNCLLGQNVSIGGDSRLMGRVTLYRDVHLGRRCLIHSGAVIGADGFGIAKESSGEWTKVPQLGGVRIGDDVEIGANTTIDRGAIEDTVIGNGVKLDNQIQVGHNVTIGDHTAIAGQVGISGSANIGARCMLAGQAGVAGHVSIADDVVILGRTMVTNSIDKAGVYAGGGVPMDEASAWRKNAVRFGQLDDMARRLRRLEKDLHRDPSDDEV